MAQRDQERLRKARGKNPRAAKQIERAAEGYHRLNREKDRALDRLYATARVHAEAFDEAELMALTGLSRPVVRKRIQGKDV